MFEVTMPQLGETVSDGTVTKWFKGVGDAVTRGELLFEVSTDKVDTEIPAQASGVISSILVEEGVTVDVGTILAVIAGEGETVQAPTASAAPVVAQQKVSAPGKVKAATVHERDKNVQLSPVVRRLLEENNLDATQVVGTGPKGRITREDVLTAVTTQAQGISDETTHGSQSPIVRRLLSEHSLDPATISGSGPNGRISRRDVEMAIDASPLTRAIGHGDEVIPFTKIRRLTAEHMVRSKATSAHTLMVRETDYERVEVVRRDYGAAFKDREGFSLTYLPFNALAVIEALREFPHLNASVGDNELIVHNDINLGIAVDLDNDGLVVPVLRQHDAWTITTMARKIRELAQLARIRNSPLMTWQTARLPFPIPGHMEPCLPARSSISHRWPSSPRTVSLASQWSSPQPQAKNQWQSTRLDCSRSRSTTGRSTARTRHASWSVSERYSILGTGQRVCSVARQRKGAFPSEKTPATPNDAIIWPS